MKLTRQLEMDQIGGGSKPDQTLLDRIKDEVAKENGHESWHNYEKVIRYLPVYSLIWHRITHRYAATCVKGKEESLHDKIWGEIFAFPDTESKRSFNDGIRKALEIIKNHHLHQP